MPRYEGKECNMNKIEKYSLDENGMATVVMSQNTARELRIAIEAFEMGQMCSSGICSKRELAWYIVKKYCDETIEIDTSNPYKIRKFVKAVKRKINELLP